MTTSAHKRRFAAMDHKIGAGTDNVQVAAYIADTASGLNQIAEQCGLSFLSYLLGLVVLEARLVSGYSPEKRKGNRTRHH
jgi:hypothetical protein